jgi:hypothetical protein
MFGRKKDKAQFSASRFCLKASELPFFELYRSSEFVVAISKLSWRRTWASSGPIRNDGLEAWGLLHMTGQQLGNPVLPVELTIGAEAGLDDQLLKDLSDIDRPGEIVGTARPYLATESGPYVLSLSVRDTDSRISEALVAALERRVAIGSPYLHMHCRRQTNPRATTSDPRLRREQHEADKLHLNKVDAGESDFDLITFEEVYFDDVLISSAPAWSWSWHADDSGSPFEKPAYNDRQTAEWRRHWGPRS